MYHEIYNCKNNMADNKAKRCNKNNLEYRTN